jgi:hypothetical protein
MGALSLAVSAAGPVPQESDLKGGGEEKVVVFLTDNDTTLGVFSPLGRRLRDGGTVNLAVILPYEYAPTSCQISEFKRIEGRAARSGDYSLETILLRREPPLKARGWFSEPMRRGATLKSITAKGTCEAVVRWSNMPRGSAMELMVCIAKIAACSDEVQPGDEFQFMTDSDGEFAGRLRQAGKINLAVIEPYKHVSAPCTLSEFKKIEGIAPQGKDYYVEGVRYRDRPARPATAYFPDPMHLGATLKGITARGTCQAVLHAPRGGTEKSIALTVCVAKISAYQSRTQLGD